MAEAKKKKDAGLRNLNHYKRRLPAWRLSLREALIPMIRYETPYLAYLQDRFRTPGLDAYFAFTANMGTHTFFMTMLPVLFWCGAAPHARASLIPSLVQTLAAGVFWSGFAKDLVCLPRPLSPPLQRISRSATSILEYGFPSTHSTNAFSVVVYGIYQLRQTDAQPGLVSWGIQGLFAFYAVSIVIGRLYCGMHGFFDVVFGSILGAAIGFIQCFYGKNFDDWIMADSARNWLVFGLIVLVLVRLHPEPADDCPCFDDSVAFSGSIVGVEAGGWIFARSGYANSTTIPSDIPFSFTQLGPVTTVLRIFVGVGLVLVWRGTMKPALLKILPPIFRVVEQLGLSLPRKFFLNASEYESVPPLRKDDAIIPPASEIATMLGSLRHPRQRSVSIGPQSEADAYEVMAVRERRRRDSQNSDGRARSVSRSANGYRAKAPGMLKFQDDQGRGVQKLPTPTVLITPADDSKTIEFPTFEEAEDTDDDVANEAMFAKLPVPRVRYDVEVVTKLIVYFGIGCISAFGGPIVFEHIGLGLGIRPAWAQK